MGPKVAGIRRTSKYSGVNRLLPGPFWSENSPNDAVCVGLAYGREMLTTVTVPLIYGGSGCNGNLELSFMDALIGIAVFTENQTMFDHAVNFWSQRVPAYFWTISDGPYPIHVPRGNQNWNDTGPTGHGGGGGSWCKLADPWSAQIGPIDMCARADGQTVFNATTNGVCQETCRDFGHTQMGMASAMCEWFGSVTMLLPSQTHKCCDRYC